MMKRKRKERIIIKIEAKKALSKSSGKHEKADTKIRWKFQRISDMSSISSKANDTDKDI